MNLSFWLSPAPEPLPEPLLQTPDGVLGVLGGKIGALFGESDGIERGAVPTNKYSTICTGIRNETYLHMTY